MITMWFCPFGHYKAFEHAEPLGAEALDALDAQKCNAPRLFGECGHGVKRHEFATKEEAEAFVPEVKT